MKKGLFKKGIVIGIIILFLGVGVQPVFANDVSISKTSDKKEECNLCPSIEDLVDSEDVEKDLWRAIDQSDGLVFVTKHSEYYDIDLSKVKSKMKTPIIIDGRNIFSKNDVESFGFTYEAIGKG